MMKTELHIEHHLNGQLVGRHIVSAHDGILTLGSSRSAGIRLMGDGVSELHACLEFDDGAWVVSDLGSERGTWLHKQPLIMHTLREAIAIQIGAHLLRLTPVVVRLDLFDEASSPSEKSTSPSEMSMGEAFHQVVIRRQGVLVSTQLFDLGEPAQVQVGDRQIAIAPPTDDQWQTRDIDGWEIKSRLARTERVIEDPRHQFARMWDPSLKTPALLAIAVLILVLGALFFLPQDPKGTMVALKPEEQNIYTRLIYDAAKVKKQMAESQKIKRKMLAQTQPAQTAQASPTMPTQAKPASGGARVVNNIKSSGLKALIGKISARASKSASLVYAAGVAPDVTGSGVALGVGRSVADVGAKDLGQGLGDGDKIAGVGTAGKGGGGGTVKGVGGLAVGNIGAATVGIIDEESEVEGGLDKDVIARYIKSQLGQIRYCYERQLSASPDLYGKVMVKFTIGESGAVVTQSVGSSSLNNAMVEGCILRRIAGWQFPAPSGGAQVIVSYPFLFKSTR